MIQLMKEFQRLPDVNFFFSKQRFGDSEITQRKQLKNLQTINKTQLIILLNQ